MNLALQRDVAMESHFRGLAFWYRVGAIVFGGGFLVMFGLIGSAIDRRSAASASLHGSSAMMAGAFGYVAMFVLACVAGSYVLGHYLARFANGARIAAAVLTIVGFVFQLGQLRAHLRGLLARERPLRRRQLLLPLGPVAGRADRDVHPVGDLVAPPSSSRCLSGRAAQICAPAYRTIVARTAQMRASLVKTPFFVVPLVATVLVALMVMRVLLARARLALRTSGRSSACARRL